MSVRIGKGSSDDPFCLDDGVESREGHNIMGAERKTGAARRIAGNNRKWKSQKVSGTKAGILTARTGEYLQLLSP